MSLPLSSVSSWMHPSGRFAAFQNSQYRRFWLAAMLHDIASWMLFAAQGWLVVELTHKPQMVALFFVLRLGPRVLCSLPAGALCDRYGALKMLRIVRFAEALPALLIVGAMLLGRLDGGVVLASAFLTSVIYAFDQPAERTLLHHYAPGKLLVGGIALCSMGATLATLTAPVLVTGAAQVGDLAWTFPVQALITLTSALVLLGNRAAPKPAPRESAPVSKDCWAAVRYLASTPAIIGLILLVGSPSMLDKLMTLVAPDYVDTQSGSGAALLLMLLAPATGALLGGSLLAWLGGEIRRLLPLAVGSSSVAVVSVGLLATSRFFIVSLLLFLILGAAKAAFSVAVMSALQRRVPDHARGRILSL